MASFLEHLILPLPASISEELARNKNGTAVNTGATNAVSQPSGSGVLYDTTKEVLGPVSAAADTTAQTAAKLGEGVHATLAEVAGGISDIGTIGIEGIGKGTGQAFADIGTGVGTGITNAAKGAIPGAIIAVVIILAIGLAIGVSGAHK